MKSWLNLLGGPLIWAAHFLLIYVIASISVQADGGVATWARALIIASAAIGACAALALLIANMRRSATEQFGAFMHKVSAFGAGLAVLAIIWQTAPVVALP